MRKYSSIVLGLWVMGLVYGSFMYTPSAYALGDGEWKARHDQKGYRAATPESYGSDVCVILATDAWTTCYTGKGVLDDIIVSSRTTAALAFVVCIDTDTITVEGHEALPTGVGETSDWSFVAPPVLRVSSQAASLSGQTGGRYAAEFNNGLNCMSTNTDNFDVILFRKAKD